MKEKFFYGLFALCACISLFAVLFICLFLFASAIPTIAKIGAWDFITGLDWYPSEEIFGIAPMILGSLFVTALSIILGVPVGIFAAIYLSHFASPKALRWLMPSVELLAAIPSVVYGFFALVLIVPLISLQFEVSGKSLLASAIILAIMILPTIILLSKSALDSLPAHYLEGALALGASKERSVFFVLIPAAKSGILASVILGVGRAIGEAMAVIMVAGNQALIPTHLLDGFRSLTTNIVLEMGYAEGLHRDVLIANAVVLFVFILLLNLSFNLIKRN